MKIFLIKNKEIVMYLLFGILTTMVNIVVYFVSVDILDINYLVSNAGAWFLSVLFAYITNRKYVFESDNSRVVSEVISFFCSRLTTGVLDMILMWGLVQFKVINDVIIKVIVNVIVIVSNYILSKLVVFKGDK